MSRDKRVVWLAACALAGALVAFGGDFAARAGGQNSNGNATGSPRTSQDAQNTNGNSNRSRGGNANGGTMNSNSGATSADAKFMTTAAAGGLAEVAAARVALERASSDQVKQYAQKMIDDHTANNAELQQLAASKGVALPNAPDPKHQAELDKLSKLSGAQFDAEYVRNSGVKDHAAMEKLMTKESGGGRDADAKAFAAKTLPAVQQHLQMARDLAAGMKGTTGANSNMGGMNMNANANANGNSNRGAKRSRNSNGNSNTSNSNNSNR
ncbi:MAG: DUF4142 domain-containing protein [Acidobacteria bacterium]|nr:DUF4142 domain-containing protein [Acidobacteriota bacterium]